MRMFAVVGGVAVCAAAILAAGCSSRDVVPLETVANAAYKTEAVGTARVAFEGTVTFNHDHAQRFEFTGHGIADWDIAFAWEAIARASAVAGDRAAVDAALARAHELGGLIADQEDRELLLSDLAMIEPRLPD